MRRRSIRRLTHPRLAALAVLFALILPLLPLPANATAQHASRAAEPAREVQVLVVGGTPAGIAAAIAAARQGLRVTLVCDRPYLGGVLTGAMMDQWDLNKALDGARIEGGIFGEIYQQLGEAFDPQTAEAAFLHIVSSYPEITVRLDTAALSADVIGNPLDRRVTEVRFGDQHSGAVFALRAPVVIDATDRGDLAALAGARYDVGRQDTGLDTKMQAATLMFAVDGVDWHTAVRSYDEERYGAGGATEKKVWGYTRLMRAYDPLSPRVIVRDLNLGREPSGRVTVNAVDVVGVDGRDPVSVSEGEAIARAEILHLMPFLRERVPGFAHARLGAFADELYIRETRHVLGLTMLTADDIWHGRVPYDTIGLASYPLDIHPTYIGEPPAYAPVRHVYGVPFRAMVPYGFDNLLVAGPAISATHVAAGSARIIPTTIEEGEAAGIAAALALHQGVDFSKIALRIGLMRRLRVALVRAGAVIDVARR
ncbi:FAD-dependent oxidoreductase [bacterium]|nr:MAG: FAD-dependent oxidoreductase [bacterium]